MKALVCRGSGLRALEDRPKPKVLDPNDVVVKIRKTTICGTDLHILKGDVPTCTAGRILGHEGTGIAETVGPAVTIFKAGDRVLISCISPCGKCEYCRRGMYSHCKTGGWIFGNDTDGTRAEYACIPHADTSLYHIQENLDEEAMVMQSDIIPTGFKCGVLDGRIENPGVNVAIVGAGPIGLATLLTAQFFSPGYLIVIDHDDNRLAVARQLGAIETINNATSDPVARVKALTGGAGMDAVVEAVGTLQHSNSARI